MRIKVDGELTTEALAAHARRILDCVLPDDTGNERVIIGPVLWDERYHGNSPVWSIIIAADVDISDCNCGRCDEFQICGVEFSDSKIAGIARAAIIDELKRRYVPIIQSFEDDLEMAREVETQWPCLRTRSIRRGLEARNAHQRRFMN